MYTDDTELTFGRYKRHKLSEVSKEYLISFYVSNRNTSDENGKQLIEYIESKNILPPIQSKKPLAIVDIETECRITGRFVRLLCKHSNKMIFLSQKDAKQEISRIRKRYQEGKKPVRAYECEWCGNWHLTSIPFEKWEKVKR